MTATASTPTDSTPTASTETPVVIDAAVRMRLVQRQWLTHDAMWFAHSVERLGIETANELNRAAVRSMAAVEAGRLRKLMAVDAVRTPAELRRFFDTAVAVVIPDVIDFTMGWAPDGQSVTFEVQRCFAFEGVSALGVADTYECGIYERVTGWLEGLGIAYRIEPDVAHCTMHHSGACRRVVTVTLPD